MTIVGFNFSKIDAYREDVLRGKIDINNNVVIKNIEEATFAFGAGQQKGLKFIFEFKSSYGQSAAHITLGGHVLFLADNAKAKEILDGWKKDKKISKEVLAGILNTVLTKCNIHALVLSKDLNLPPPIPLPKINMSPAGDVKGADAEKKAAKAKKKK